MFYRHFLLSESSNFPARCVPMAYGLKKLQIVCVVEDEKVSTDALEEAICDMEDCVSIVDTILPEFQKDFNPFMYEYCYLGH